MSVLPLFVTEKLSVEQQERWDRQFVDTGRTAAEGIWRRTQNEINQVKSGWQGPQDARRRMLHFVDHYEVTEEDPRLALVDAYLYASYALPSEEAETLVEDVRAEADKGDWTRLGSKLSLGNLVITLDAFRSHPEDEAVGRTFPSNYRIVEFLLTRNDGGLVNTDRARQPWQVLNTGIRQQGRRTENVNLLDAADFGDINKYLPAQLELGGGASVESGIPGLHFLHDVYSVSDADGNFVFGNDRLLPKVLADPRRFFTEEASFMYRQAITVEPSEFYRQIARMYKAGLFVGEVITNNFDGLSSLVGLQEHFVRSYDEAHIIPNIDFHPNARSLIVVGSHADRRKVQQAAREKGLKVIYVDPELIQVGHGYKQYLLESVAEEDILIPLTADNFARLLGEVALS